MEKLTNQFLIPFYKLIFEEYPPCMSHGAMEAVLEIIHWFASQDGNFLSLFCGQKSSHILPSYSIDKLVTQEFVYHLFTGLLTAFHRKKKSPWPTLPMQIRL